MGTWRQRRLGELICVKHGYAFLGQYFGVQGSHIVLTPGNFHEQGGFKIRNGTEKRYSGPFPDEFILNEGDLLIAMTEQGEGLLGSSALVPTSNLYLHNQRLGLIEILDEQECDKKFLYYLFNSRSVRQRIRATATGTKIRHTSPTRVCEVDAWIPCISEQRRIAGIISAYDDLIENCQRRIRILEEMARSLYREWFVNFRYPGYEEVPLLDTAFGPVPQGWDLRKLSAVAEINRAQINPRTAPEELRYIDISSVSPGQIDTVTTYAFADAPGRARRIVQHGDILWSCVRPNRRSHALVMRPEPDTIASTGFAALTGRKVPFTYLYCATTTDEFVSYLSNNATGAAYPAVTATTFLNADLLIPPDSLLARFGEITTPMYEEAETLRRKVNNCRSTRGLLLPRLLSGDVAG